MRVRIVEGRVAELDPVLGDEECAMIVDVAPEVRVGWFWSPKGCTTPPALDPNADIDAQILALEALQTPRLLREALKKKSCTVNKPGTIIHGLSPEDAIDAIDDALTALRAQLVGEVYYQEK